ncbi:transporter substrate-binding domain-containing protein [Anaeromyxobacter oryzae]|uniref:histidine kinase n=1 Tax=Anaeromyxobacter oryzae TaxID=2918170 RepID=A0ABM7WNS7_9BACT|nr:transporter substrate-binding domain-containing protein [Anaeromyxobacter oryzae]BDG01119.1 histidine kinase [Anaeromyxobacter oryzae]
MRRRSLAPLAAALLALAGPAARGQDLAGAAVGGGTRRTIVVGADRDYPPYEFLDRDGKPAGYNVELTRAIAEVMGLEVEFRFGDWSEIRAGLDAGQIDVLEGISFSDERARTLDFSPPHAIVHHAIFARRGTPPVASLEELRGKEVIVFGGGIMDETLTQRGLGATLVRTGTPADALRLLASGEHDYVVVALLPGIWITRELQLTNVVPVARSIAAERYGFAVRKGNGELLARLDEGLAILKKTGRYEELHQRWLGVLEPQGLSLGTVARWATLVLVPLLAILAGTVLWSRSLQRQVAVRTASLAREVAERRRAVEELRQHQRQLVQADKLAALGVLVSGVAHEINNPVGLVLLNMPLLKETFGDLLSELDARGGNEGLTIAGLPYARLREELPGLLDEMHAGGRRIKRIVDDLKDFARREDDPALEPVDLNDVARAAARLVGNAIRNATDRFELALGDGLPRVRVNSQRIEQVVVNLLLNACEALPDASHGIRLSTRHDAERGEVLLEVRDQGVGIPPEHLARIEEPFFTTKRTAGGTGLGLSVSAGIVKDHGGTLRFTSEVGAGTVATIALPALAPADAEERRSAG